MVDTIFIVFGEQVQEDFSNVQVIKTTLIPNVGDHIITFGARHKILQKVINYTQVEKFDNINDDERGKETVWLFV